jgi:Na+/melibiose symporter-like transporter
VPWVVPENVVGFSYGVMTALQNAGLAIFPLITGAVLDAYTYPKSNVTNTTFAPSSYFEHVQRGMLMDDDKKNNPTLLGFKYTEGIFMFSATISLLASIVLLILDWRGSGVLSAPAEERRLREQQRKAEQQKLLNDGTSEF